MTNENDVTTYEEIIVAEIKKARAIAEESGVRHRRYINDVVLPLIQGHELADKYERRARQIFNVGSRDAIAMHDRAIELFEPQGPYTVLPDELTYLRGDPELLICPYFCPTIWFHEETTPEDVDCFAERMAADQTGNGTRGFAYGIYEPIYKRKDWLVFPWPMVDDWVFDVFDENPVYWEQLYRKIESFAKRHLMSVIDMNENCALKLNPPGHWKHHPLNGANNVNGTSTWNLSPWHYYEDQHQDVPGIKQTKRAIEEFEAKLVARLEERFAPWVKFSAGNEVHAAHGWHALKDEIVKNASGNPEFPLKRKLTSMSDDGFYWKRIDKLFRYSVHGCKDFETYLERKKIIRADVPFMASQDGHLPPLDVDQVADDVFNILSDGRVFGYELNLPPYYTIVSGKWEFNLARCDWSLRSMEEQYAKAVREGWFKYLTHR